MSAVAAKASRRIVVARAKPKAPQSPAPLLRDCGCPYGSACTCGPRLRIFDPMGRLLMSPVYY
jgi:hypothetical protein